ncbi:head maturation protease, ClpP-related [Evansella cellulosilytica]|uniref:ATP-dependent Clp protease proteolytic subunit n=1 Tax=Evansella cellulosilytica (strain ATCC 21833 / DSM 2522 / FERM P-1141 / JCM 9156 / N-4) TaxID=649639 RepID=E6TVG9_EVAC2|nr:head maturation protease, ClpP-related [Evansella cellulosilytica]ADU30986.1 peptidase S14 ClpP [Evansella cellulosilytica DSM 2522]
MKIPIKGPIVSDDDIWIYEWFGIGATSPKTVSKLIEEANGEDLEVEINSGGGSVWAGSEIYTLLKSCKQNVVVNIMGIAASAASVAAMGGKLIRIAPTGQIMIHNSMSGASGDHRELEHAAEMLKGVDRSIANAYILKTGKNMEELLSLMAKETYMGAKEAKELGFADEIMFDEDDQLVVASFDQSSLLPRNVINKVRNLIDNPNSITDTTDNSQQNHINEPPKEEPKKVAPISMFEKQIKMNERRGITQ